MVTAARICAARAAPVTRTVCITITSASPFYAIQQGILTKSTKDRLETLEATKEDLEIKVANEKLAKPKMTAEQVRYWVTRFRKLDVRIKEHRKMLIDVFLNAVYVYDDRVLITFNYKDGTSTITFDDLKNTPSAGTGSDLESSGAPAKSPKSS